MPTVQNTQSEGRRISREPVRNRRVSDLKSVKCSECAAIVINDVHVIKRHMNTKHVKLPIQTCKVCDKVFYLDKRNLALEHARKAHKGGLELVLDQKAENWAALNDHLAKYFPDASVKKE
ncbi:hypothetical protein Ddc_18093 [Ditylenchus destructor]|nr:hypothetical protein Ddc_18093 [Ditylenchus destructor]